MSTESSQSRQFDEILRQSSPEDQARLEAVRAQFAATPGRDPAVGQGQAVGRDSLGELAGPATPHHAAKDLVQRYGRESYPAPERTPSKEPDR